MIMQEINASDILNTMETSGNPYMAISTIVDHLNELYFEIADLRKRVEEAEGRICN